MGTPAPHLGAHLNHADQYERNNMSSPATSQKLRDWLGRTADFAEPRANWSIALLQAAAESDPNVTYASATASYLEHASQIPANQQPTTVYDGLQTLLNICKTRSGFDPYQPDDQGDFRHFSDFMSHVSSCPLFTLTVSQTSEVHYSGSPVPLAQILTDQLVSLTTLSKPEAQDAAQTAVSIIESWIGPRTTSGTLAFNVLQDERDGASSAFLVAKPKNDFDGKRGTSSSVDISWIYTEYLLSDAIWQIAKDQLAGLANVTVDEWLSSMRTHNHYHPLDPFKEKATVAQRRLTLAFA
jgi:hypothetical protein